MAKQKDVYQSIHKLLNHIMMNGTSYLHQKKGYSAENTHALFIYCLREEAEGSNYDGLMALGCLAHELDFRAVIYDEMVA